MQDNIKAAICNTADWLAANHDKHIQLDLATDANGQSLSNPLAPEAACFCAFGRLAVEVDKLHPELNLKKNFEAWAGNGDDGTFDDPIEQVTKLTGLSLPEVYTVNDAAGPNDDDLGNPEVIDFLRKRAEC